MTFLRINLGENCDFLVAYLTAVRSHLSPLQKRSFHKNSRKNKHLIELALSKQRKFRIAKNFSFTAFPRHKEVKIVSKFHPTAQLRIDLAFSLILAEKGEIRSDDQLRLRPIRASLIYDRINFYSQKRKQMDFRLQPYANASVEPAHDNH